MARYVCIFCKHVHGEAEGDVRAGIMPGTLWEDVPGDWLCPGCRQPKSAFRQQDSR